MSKLKGAASHHAAEIAELQADRELAAVAAEAGISRESLYRALSPRGNPTIKTLLVVLKTVGMRLSVEPENHAHA